VPCFVTLPSVDECFVFADSVVFQVSSEASRHSYSGEVVCEIPAILCETSEGQKSLLLPVPHGVGHAERRN
jgi:hypothetical protein